MSYRPHKRKRATTLKDITIAAISSDLDAYFRPGVLSEKLRGEILAFLCFSPDLIPLPRGFLNGMTEMNLGGCVLPDGLFAQIAEEAPGLLSLDLKQCSGHEMLRTAGFEALSTGCGQLEAISLVGVMTLTDDHLGHLTACRRLKGVRLGGCISLTAPALVAFLQARGSGLEVLDLSGCRVTSEVLEAVHLHCRELREFQCGYLEDVPPRALPLVLRSLRNLRILGLARCAVVGDATLLLIGRHLAPTLTDLDITGCKRVTSEGVIYLAWHCKDLQSLKVKYCSGLSPDFHERLPKLFPQIAPDKIERDRPRFYKEP